MYFPHAILKGMISSEVKSDSRGKKSIDIKNSTTDDKVRACLSTLVDPEDASAQEIWYHKNCIVYAERTCIMDCDNDTDNRYSVKRKLVDLEFVAIAKYALEDGETFNMSGLNEEYISLLIEHGIDETSDNYKKYIKDLLQKSVDNINFVGPSRKSESEKEFLMKLLVMQSTHFLMNIVTGILI